MPAQNQPRSSLTDEEALICRIEDAILDVANAYEEMTTSDLQGFAGAKAKEIRSWFK